MASAALVGLLGAQEVVLFVPLDAGQGPQQKRRLGFSLACLPAARSAFRHSSLGLLACDFCHWGHPATSGVGSGM